MKTNKGKRITNNNPHTKLNNTKCISQIINIKIIEHTQKAMNNIYWESSFEKISNADSIFFIFHFNDVADGLTYTEHITFIP